jgi:hypothetical protein
MHMYTSVDYPTLLLLSIITISVVHSPTNQLPRFVLQPLPDFHRSPLNVITNCYKEGPIPSLPIEPKLWGKGRFETIQNNQTPGNDANFFSPYFNHQTRWSKPFGSTESDMASCWFRRDVEMKNREEASILNRHSPERKQAVLPNAQRQRGNTISKQSTNIIKTEKLSGV